MTYVSGLLLLMFECKVLICVFYPLERLLAVGGLQPPEYPQAPSLPSHPFESTIYESLRVPSKRYYLLAAPFPTSSVPPIPIRVPCHSPVHPSISHARHFTG